MKPIFISHLCALLLLASQMVFAQSIGGVINQYRSVSNINLSAGEITVSPNASPFIAGDEVLIIQMKGASIDESESAAFGSITSIGNAGNYEKAEIVSINGNVLSFSCGFNNTYDVAGKIQVVTIPKYTGTTTITSRITADPWDGNRGGIVVFEAEDLLMEAPIDVTGLGFRAGVNNSDDKQDCELLVGEPLYLSTATNKTGAEKGEGIAETSYMYSIGRLANGGGGGGLHNGSGGGGSNWGDGGSGGIGYTDCEPYTNPQNAKGTAGTSLSAHILAGRIFMGGGGGAGQGNNSAEPNNLKNYGGNGGGIVMVKANQIITNWSADCNSTFPGARSCNQISIFANGLSAPNNDTDDRVGTNGTVWYDGAGGGGAGGSVILDIGSIDISIANRFLHVEAVGGKGGYTSSNVGCYAPGGGGGGGYVHFVNATMPVGINNVLVDGGDRGIMLGGQENSAPCLVDREHRDGNDGSVDYNLTFPQMSCNCNRPSSVSITSLPISSCEGASDNLSGTYAAGGSSSNGGMHYVWYKSGTLPTAAQYTSTSGTISDQLFSPLTPADSGVWILRVQDGNDPNDNACMLEDSVSVQVDEEPSTATAGQDQVVCESVSSVTLAASTPTVGSGVWSVITGTGTFVDNTDPGTSVGGLSAGANTFRWTVSNGVCPDSEDEIVVTVDEEPSIADAGNDQSICETTSSVGLTAAVPLVGTGMWSTVTGSGTLVDATDPVTSVGGLSIGINTFRWTVSNGVCSDSQDDVSINIDSAPSSANAGSDTVICQTTYSIGLGASAPALGVGSWSLISGAGNMADITDPGTSVNGLGIGTNTFRWTVSNGVCPNSQDDMMITVDESPSAADAGLDQVVCETTSSVSLTAAVPSAGQGAWSIIAGTGVFSDLTDPNTSVSNFGIGVNTYQWITSNGVCAASMDTISLTADEAPSISNAGPDKNLCTTTATLAGNVPVVGMASWSILSGPALVADTSNPASGISGLQVGNNAVVWTVRNGVCSPSVDTVVIWQTGSQTSPQAGADTTICESVGALILSANAVSAGELGTWSSSGDGGFSSVNDPQATYNPGAGDLGNGSVTLSWLVSKPTCVAQSDDVVITIDASPSAAVAGVDQIICETDSVLSLGATLPIVGNGSWSLVSGTVVFADPSDPFSSASALSLGSNVLRWTTSNGVCSQDFDDVTINVDQSPSMANAGLDQVVCESTAGLSLSAVAPSVGAGVWTVFAGSGVFSDATSESSSLTGLTLGLNTFQWTVTNGVCANSQDDVSVLVEELPSQSDAGLDQDLCTTAAQLGANTPSVGTGMWSVLSGGGSLSDPLDPLAQVSNLGVGENLLQWTVANGTCAPSRDTVRIWQAGSQTNPNAGLDVDLCETAGSVGLLANAVGANETGMWSTLGDGVFSSLSDPMASYVFGANDLSTGSVTLTWVISKTACTPQGDNVLVTIDADPGLANAGVDQDICGSSASLGAQAPLAGTGLWTITSGAGVVADPTDPTSAIAGLSGTTLLEWTVSNGTCSPTSDQIQIEATIPERPAVSLSVSDNEICLGDSAIFTANASAAGSNPNYEFVVNGTSVQNGGSSILSVSLPSLFNRVEVRMTPLSSCFAGSAPFIALDTLVVVNPPVVSIAGDGERACQFFTVTAVSSSGDVQWNQIGEGQYSEEEEGEITVNETGQFYALVDNGVCKAVSSDTVGIVIDELPIIDAGQSIQMNIDESIQLEAFAAPVTGLNWSIDRGEFDDATSLNPMYTALFGGTNTYVLTALNGSCQAQDELVIVVEEPIHIPNVFTPNGDGYNDVHSISGLESYANVALRIFNRWGNLVYENYGEYTVWDGSYKGKKLPVATYYYVLEVGSDEEHKFSGYIELLR